MEADNPRRARSPNQASTSSTAAPISPPRPARELYLVAWGATNGVVAQRLLPDGTKVDAAPFVVRANHFGPADVAAIGNTFLVTSRRYGYTPQFIDAYGTRVRGSDGAVLDTLLLGGGYVSRPPVVTTLGGKFYIAFHSNWSHDNSGASTDGVLVPTTGTNLTSSGVYLFSTAGGNGIFELGLASSGDKALLVQSAEITSGVENDVLGFVIDTNGAPSARINFTPWPGNQYRPRVAWDGLNFIIAYQDQKNRLALNTLEQLDARSDLFAMRVSPPVPVLALTGKTSAAGANVIRWGLPTSTRMR